MAARGQGARPRRRHLVLSARRRRSRRRARRRSISAPMPRTWRRCSARTSSRSSRRPSISSSTPPRRSTRRRRSTSRPWPARIRHVVQSCFDGRRIVVFSGGEAKDVDGVYRRGARHPRRRRQRLDHRPQHLPAAARRRRSRCSTRSSRSTRARRERRAREDRRSRRCRLYLVTPPALEPGALRRPRSPRRSTPATSPACSSASRTSTTTRSAAPATSLLPVAQARDVAFLLNDRPGPRRRDRLRRRPCRPGGRALRRGAARSSAPTASSASPATTAGTSRWRRPRRAPTMSPSAPSSRPTTKAVASTAPTPEILRLVERDHDRAVRRDRRHHAGELRARWSRPAPTSSPSSPRCGTTRRGRARRCGPSDGRSPPPASTRERPQRDVNRLGVMCGSQTRVRHR